MLLRQNKFRHQWFIRSAEEQLENDEADDLMVESAVELEFSPSAATAAGAWVVRPSDSAALALSTAKLERVEATTQA